MLSDFFKSRYTRSLEERVIELKLEISRKDERIAELLEKLTQRVTVAPASTTPFLTAGEITKLQRRKVPPSVNFIQARDGMERASAAGVEVKELSAEEIKKQQEEEN